MDNIRYFIKEGLKNFWINRVMSLASVSVLTVCMVLLGTSLLVSLNIRQLVSEVEGQNQVMVYLKDGLKQTDILSVGDKIQNISNVNKSIFVSKQEGLQDLKKSLGQDAYLLNGLENDNPLQNAYQVQLKDSSRYAQTVSQISKIKGVDSLTEHINLAVKLTNIRRVINIIGIWLFVILIVVSLFIIMNTIKLAMYVRKREINIMKFVGATDWFIRFPFMVEGLFIGLISAVIAFLLQWYLYTRMISAVVGVLGLIKPLQFQSVSFYTGAGFLVTGVLVGVLGSILSVRRYLKV